MTTKPMRALARDCPACQADVFGTRAFCIYCQKYFLSAGTLHVHIKKMHPGTVRHQACHQGVTK